ncbi:hypothetical protein ACRHM7_07350 [Chromohalobacter israelensis]|uniref:hypothetical protein n=1 Tax=Chromohalobacter israelensis TaxID=141390 RepID=UPI003D7A2B38
MIDIEKFFEIRERFGHFASWAVWADEGVKPKDNIDDLSVLNPGENPNLLQIVHANAILLGLNISREIERPFGNFHDPRPMATDFKIRYALKGTDYWGAYMTDVVKDFEEKVSGNVMSFLRHNKDFERESIQKLREEIKALGFPHPILVAFGKDTEKIVKRNLSQEFRIIGIPHYANFISKENYRERVSSRLPELPSDRNAKLGP